MVFMVIFYHGNGRGAWKLNRKIISKMLHLDALEKYFEPIDISAITFSNKLSVWIWGTVKIKAISHERDY